MMCIMKGEWGLVKGAFELGSRMAGGSHLRGNSTFCNTTLRFPQKKKCTNFKETKVS